MSNRQAARACVIASASLFLLTLFSSGQASAHTEQVRNFSSAQGDGRVLPPERAKDIAAGLIDATGPLGLQCGMSKLGEKIRTGATPTTRVASAAIKDSLTFAGAKKGCSAATEVLKAAGVIVAYAEINRPVYVELAQSTKNNLWPKPDTCSVAIRVGESESLSKSFKASFSC